MSARAPPSRHTVRRLAWPSLPVTVPLLLLFFALSAGLYDLRQSSRAATRSVEESTRDSLITQLHEMQHHLEYLFRAEDPERAREEVARLGGDRHLKVAFLVNEDDTVFASTQRIFIGRPLSTVRPDLLTGASAQGIERAREVLAGEVHVTEDGSTAVGISPVVGPLSSETLRYPSIRVLIIEKNLASLKAEALLNVQRTVARRVLALALLAALLSLVFHFALTRRVQHLVSTARQFARRNWSARSRLRGEDELALLGRAFDELAEHIQRDQMELEERETRIRLLLNSTAEGIYGLDLEGNCTFCNQAALQLLGYRSAGEVLGKKVHELWHHSRPDGTPHSASECDMLRSATSGEPVHAEDDVLWRADGTALPVEYWAHPMSQGNRLVGVVVTFVDITERKQAESAQRFLIRATTELARMLDVDRVLECLARLATSELAQWCVIDMVEEGEIRRAVVFHHSHERQALLQKFSERHAPGWHSLLPTARVLTMGHRMLVEESLGSLFLASHQEDENLRLLHALGARTAITLPLKARGETLGAMLLVSAAPGFQYGEWEVALAEELAWRASVSVDNARLYRQSQQAVRLREEFLSVASHELHTPLTPLLLQLQFLRRSLSTLQAEQVSRLAPHVDKALHQVQRLGRLVDDLLDVSRITAGRLPLRREEVDLEALTGEILDRHGHQALAAGCELRTRLEGPMVGWVDRMRMEQVFTNLLSNALKYGAGHPVEVSLRQENGQARWSVRDHGIGIAPEHHERIFGRFERAASIQRYGGLGLGLYISRELVRAHGGTIYVESTPGQGTLFTVEFPLVAVAAVEAGHTAHEEARSAPSL